MFPLVLIWTTNDSAIMAGMDVLKAHELVKRYGKNLAVDGVSL